MRYLTGVTRAAWLMAMVVLAVAGPGKAGEAPPRHVASANLCADQLLMALADDGQIASLSPYARDPDLSWLADRARAFPLNRGSGEDIVRLDADLVLLGPYDGRYTRALLQERGVRFVSLDPWTDFDQGLAQIRQVAGLLGHPERGEALIATITRALDEVRAHAVPRDRPPSALVLHRRGFVYHAGLTGAIAEAAGLRDAAPAIGVSSSGFVSMEKLVAARPDYLIVSDADPVAQDQGQAFLLHPALVRLWPPSRRIVAPDRLTICGGPSSAALIRTLAAEIAAKVR